MYNNYQNKKDNQVNTGNYYNSSSINASNSNNYIHSNKDISGDPRLRNVSPIKLKIIKEIAEKSKGRSIDEMLPQIIQVNKELQSRNISFTKEETTLLLEVIEETLPPKDKAKFNMLKGFLQ